MEQILSNIEESRSICEDIARVWYRKSHNHYEPSEQITRDYKTPFDKCAIFGKAQKAPGTRVKKLLTWINDDPVTLVNRRQMNFVERTRSSIGQIKDPETLQFYSDMVHGKKTIRAQFDASDALRDFDLDKNILFWWQCLQDLNIYRRKLRKRVPEVSFSDIEDNLSCLDNKCIGVLPEDKVFMILEKYYVYPNKKFFVPLIDTLQFRKDKNINYREVMDLLNWRRNLPILPKMQVPLTSTDYVTTYSDSIGKVQTIDNTKLRAAGISSENSDPLIATIPRNGICMDKENLGDQTSLRCLLSPSIFTRHGLTHIDFFKARSKEEMQDIFENIGFEFPGNTFDVFWQKGIEKDCTDGICIETFWNLIAASNFVVKNVMCE